MEVITGLMFAIIAFVAFFYSYKVNFIDRIADIKNMFLTFQLICVLVSIGLLILFSCISKSRDSLIRNIIFVTIISILALMIQGGIKIFLEAYIQENVTAYLNFKVKTVTYIVIYILEILIMCYLIYRLKKHDNAKDKLEKDDEVLYDEEENVKL